MTNNHSDVFTEAAKAAPTVTVGGLTLYGVGLSDYVLIVTLIYTVLQIYFLVRDKWWKPRKAKNGSK
jgi:hypothetical protein